MREFDFRVWDKVEKKMLFPDDQQFILIPTRPSWGADKCYDSNYGDIDESCFDWGSGDLIGGRYVIMQYTGLKDMKGNKLYEGDVVKKHDPQFPEYDGSIGQITYIADLCEMGFYIDLISGDECSFYYPDGANWSDKEIERIGDIYQNPELLPKEK